MTSDRSARTSTREWARTCRSSVPARPFRQPRCSRLTQAFRLIRGLLRHHKRLFFTAVGGAAVFAVVHRGLVGRRAARSSTSVIVPRFEEGTVGAGASSRDPRAADRSSAWCVPSVSSVRRTCAGRTAWRVTESLTAEVIDRVVAQPVPWHRRQTHRRPHHARRRRRRGRHRSARTRCRSRRAWC